MPLRRARRKETLRLFHAQGGESQLASGTARNLSGARPHSRADSRPLVLHWVFGHLRKRGSFEDYLVKMAEATRRAGLRFHVVSRLLIDPALRSTLEALGAGVTCMRDDELNSSGSFIRVVLQLRPSLVHCHFGSPSTGLALLAKILGVRWFLFTDHGSRTSLDDSSALSLRHLRRHLLSRFVDLYLPVSDFVREQILREVGVAPRKVERLFNGIDLARFRPAVDPDERARIRVRRLGVAPEQRCVFYIGQLTESKGVDDILAVQDRILALKEDVTFIWIGDGPLAAEVERRASARVRQLGLCNNVEELLPAADLIVAPSRWHEAFCLTVAEAAAAGVPAIATRVGGVPEVVRDGETGLLIEPGDRDALYEAIAQLLDDEPRRAAMGAAARRRAETLFCLDTMVDSTLAHYQALGLPMRDAKMAPFILAEV